MKIIDMHCDTLGICIPRNDRPAQGLAVNDKQIDIQKLKKGGALAQFFAIFIPPMKSLVNQTVAEASYDYFNKMYKAYVREMELNHAEIAPAMNYQDIMNNDASGKISSILTIEDGVPLDGKMERLHEFYEKGVRLISFTWNFENSVGYPNAKDPELMAKGLKPFGFDVVAEMNRLGMLIDVSHLSDGGFWDVIKHSSKPFVASHSCCRTLCNHTRNLTDEMLKALGEKGGVVGINFCANFLNEEANYTDIDSVVRHMLHIRDKAGLEAVGFGSDFDGIGSELEFVDYAGMPRILDALSKHFTEDEMDKITSGNALRVIRETLK